MYTISANMDSTSTPLSVFIKLLAIVFIAEAGVMYMLPVVLPRSTAAGTEAFVDSCLLTLLTAPLVWWVIIGPLRASAAAEKMAAVAQIATGVAHELRNPLTAVKMLVQTQRELPDVGDQLAEDLTIIEDEIRRMERSIQTFLDFAKPQAPRRRPTNPTDVVRLAFALVEPRARNQRVDLKLIEPETPLTVEADSEQLLQLFLNLCLNALDMMPDGGTLIVESQQVDKLVSISVRDTGRGIEPEVLSRLFQPFVTSKETGVGIGLAICKRIAEAHRGRIRGENLVQGACFTLELPAKS
jgi:two-component system sensor histidine kinase HydH